MKSKMKRRNIIIIFLLNVLFQATVFSRIEILGVHPNVSIPLIIVFSAIDGTGVGSAFALATGLIEELLFSRVIGVRTLIYFIVAYTIGERSKKINIRNTKPLIGFAVLATLISFLGNHLIFGYFGEPASLRYLFSKPIPLEMIWNIGLTLLFYHYYGKGRVRKNYYGF